MFSFQPISQAPYSSEYILPWLIQTEAEVLAAHPALTSLLAEYIQEGVGNVGDTDHSVSFPTLFAVTINLSNISDVFSSFGTLFIQDSEAVVSSVFSFEQSLFRYTLIAESAGDIFVSFNSLFTFDAILALSFIGEHSVTFQSLFVPTIGTFNNVLITHQKLFLADIGSNNGRAFDFAKQHVNLFSMDTEFLRGNIYEHDFDVTITSSIESTNGYTAEHLQGFAALIAINSTFFAGQQMKIEANLPYLFTASITGIADGYFEHTVVFPFLFGLSSIATFGLQAVFTSTYVVNIRTKAHSTYSNFNFNSFATINGAIYGCSSVGIQKITGSLDNTAIVEASLRTGLFDFGTFQQKAVDNVYVNSRNNEDELELTTITDETREATYDIYGSWNDGMRNKRIKTARGIRGRHWQFEVANRAGGTFDVQSLEIMPSVLKRRI